MNGQSHGRKSLSKNIQVRTYMTRHIGDVSKYTLAEFHVVNGGNAKDPEYADSHPFDYIPDDGYCTVITLVDDGRRLGVKSNYQTAERMLLWWEIVDRRVLIEKTGCYI